MSTLKVDTINEKTSGNGVQIPGHVIQVVQGTSTAYLQSFSANTHTDTGLTATITPKSASSKVLVLHSSSILVTNTHDCILRLLRGSTVVHNLNFYSTTGYSPFSGAFQYLDSPSTTSATTYKTQMYYNQNEALYNYNNEVTSKSTLTLMEIAQ